MATDPISALRAFVDNGGLIAPASKALAELERRARIEARLAVFAKGKGGFEGAWRPGAERMTLRWTTDWESHEGAFWGRTPHAYSGDGPDYWTALEAALNAAGAP